MDSSCSSYAAASWMHVKIVAMKRPSEAAVRITTRKGDDGTTGVLFGGRVTKDSAGIKAVGAVDEAQAAIGVARAYLGKDFGEAQASVETREVPRFDALLVRVERDLWILMAEVSAGTNRSRLEPGKTAVTAAMVEALEERIEALGAGLVVDRGFAVPGGSLGGALLDAARAAARRAERYVVAAGRLGEGGEPALSRGSPGSVADPGIGAGGDGKEQRTSYGIRYLNRLSDLLWVLARIVDGPMSAQGGG